jgi:hypothetical protein
MSPNQAIADLRARNIAAGKKALIKHLAVRVALPLAIVAAAAIVAKKLNDSEETN